MNGVAVMSAPSTGPPATPVDATSRTQVLSPRIGGAGVASISVNCSIPPLPVLDRPMPNSSSRVSSAQLTGASSSPSSPPPPHAPTNANDNANMMRRMKLLTKRVARGYSQYGRGGTSVRSRRLTPRSHVRIGVVVIRAGRQQHHRILRQAHAAGDPGVGDPGDRAARRE